MVDGNISIQSLALLKTLKCTAMKIENNFLKKYSLNAVKITITIINLNCIRVFYPLPHLLLWVVIFKF